MKKILIGVVAITLASPVFAWGEREQGVLAGIAGVLLYNQLNKAAQQPQYHPPVVNHQPYYDRPYVQAYPQRQFCDVSYVTDRFGHVRQITYCYQR